MKNSSVGTAVLLCLAALVIYYPVFTTDYLYTDETLQLWKFGENLNFNTSVPQGRFLTYKLFVSIFNHIHTIHDVKYARLFSFSGWLIVLPVWYMILSKLISLFGWPYYMTVLALVYLVSMPAFAISIGWAACMELFIAYTSGLIAGYCVYTYLENKENPPGFSILLLVSAVLFGLAALFTYQNGFGCFFIPFFLKLISSKKITRTVWLGAVMAILMYCLYFLLFRYTLSISGLPPGTRTAVTVNPFEKLFFFVSRPLVTAFHFTWLFNEKSIPGVIFSIIFIAACFLYNFVKSRSTGTVAFFSYWGAVFIFMVLIYLPSLIVTEKYASNRTLLALNLAIFFLVAESLFAIARTKMLQSLVAAAVSMFFLINAWYNFHHQFIYPLRQEYNAIKGFMDQYYQPAIKKLYVIKPREDAFHIKYGIVQSWDEFGIPSTAMPWAPEPLIRQLVFEKTGNRAIAENLSIEFFTNSQRFQPVQRGVGPGHLLLDMPALINNENRASR